MVDTDFHVPASKHRRFCVNYAAREQMDPTVSGLAGTHSWISPAADIAAILFTQRMPGFWHASGHEYKRQVYAAVS